VRFPTFDAIDDRGRTVRVSGPRTAEFVSFRTPVVGPTPRGATELVQRLAPTREMFGASPPAVGKRGTWLATVLAAAFVIAITVLLRTQTDLHWADIWFFVFGFLIAAAASVYGWLELFGIIKPPKRNLPSTQDLLDRIAREGSCFACGYPFAGLNPEPDGCTCCPECGAAWKLTTPTSLAP
jgi:hypothetical protein